MSDLGKDSLETAAGEGLTLEDEGTTYEINPFTLGDFTVFRKHIKSQRLQSIMEAAKDLPTEERNKLILSASSEPVTDEFLMQESTTMEGITFLLSKSLKEANPDLTEDTINEIITKQILEEEKELLSVINGINGGGEVSENPPKSEEKN